MSEKTDDPASTIVTEPARPDETPGPVRSTQRDERDAAGMIVTEPDTRPQMVDDGELHGHPVPEANLPEQ